MLVALGCFGSTKISKQRGHSLDITTGERYESNACGQVHLLSVETRCDLNSGATAPRGLQYEHAGERRVRT
jgi:hypothetical protein